MHKNVNSKRKQSILDRQKPIDLSQNTVNGCLTQPICSVFNAARSLWTMCLLLVSVADIGQGNKGNSIVASELQLLDANLSCIFYIPCLWFQFFLNLCCICTLFCCVNLHLIGCHLFQFDTNSSVISQTYLCTTAQYVCIMKKIRCAIMYKKNISSEQVTFLYKSRCSSKVCLTQMTSSWCSHFARIMWLRIYIT